MTVDCREAPPHDLREFVILTRQYYDPADGRHVNRRDEFRVPYPLVFEGVASESTPSAESYGIRLHRPQPPRLVGERSN